MNIYVGNLHYGINDEDLKDVFEEYGEVMSAKVIVDRETGRSKGFGFVEMSDEAATKAIEDLEGAELSGRTMKVNESKPKPQRKSFDRKRNY
ncbi:MAG: RNA-binding protein [Marinifilaceae bacterium]|jgi:RNA recognition motif-containing protein|nr:RNA-binding protein [Marinilabiliaceae bacterium JC040]MCT4600633.1 RNA-binding protein [Marinifilaceae bacterium]